MMIKQTYTEKDFDKITKVELHRLWFREALTDRQIAKLYGITKDKVKQKRKEYNLRYFNSAILSLLGNSEYRAKKKKNVT